MNGHTLAAALDLGAGGLEFPDLVGADGRSYGLESFSASPVLVLVFVASGCPTVRYYRERLGSLQDDRRRHGVQVVAVNSNNPHLSAADSLRDLQLRHLHEPWPFPYLKDPDGGLARRCGAICTPHAFVFDAERRLRYRGRIDDSRTGRRVTRHDLEDAVDDVIRGRPVRVPETDPFGCAVVW